MVLYVPEFMHDSLTREVLEKYCFLTEKAWVQFCTIAQSKSFKKGEHLLMEGSVSKYFYFIVDGAVRFYRISDRGDENTCRFVFENTFFTEEISFFKQRPAEGNIVFLESSTLLAITHANFEHLFCKFQEWMYFINGLMVENVLAMIKREEMILAANPVEAYKNLFESMPFLFLRIEQKYIASYMGITPETFSRVKRKVFGRK